MPQEYAIPAQGPPGTTTYLAVSGKGLMFEGTKGRTLADIKDGLSHTIMLVEANDERAVPWTKPEDWECDPEHPLAGLGRPIPAASAWPLPTGRARSSGRTWTRRPFTRLFTIAGGEGVEPPK